MFEYTMVVSIVRSCENNNASPGIVVGWGKMQGWGWKSFDGADRASNKQTVMRREWIYNGDKMETVIW